MSYTKFKVKFFDSNYHLFFVVAGTGTRTVTTLPQGVRLTPTAAVKNGNAIPVSVVTSSTGTQLMYVVQQTSPLMTTTAQGGPKAVLLNFQPGNGILCKFSFEFFEFRYFKYYFNSTLFLYFILDSVKYFLMFLFLIWLDIIIHHHHVVLVRYFGTLKIITGLFG